jgi:NADH:ubiquinone oxidoreductase subunit 6 (subunit J)
MVTTLAASSFNPDFWDGVWWIISLAIAVIVVFVVIYTFVDNFTRHDHGGWAKALWAILIIFLPILGTIIYLVVRPVDAA